MSLCRSHPLLHLRFWQVIQEGVERWGCKWRQIAALLPGRSDSSIRNRWMRLLKASTPGEEGQPQEELRASYPPAVGLDMLTPAAEPRVEGGLAGAGALGGGGAPGARGAVGSRAGGSGAKGIPQSKIDAMEALLKKAVAGGGGGATGGAEKEVQDEALILLGFAAQSAKSQAANNGA